LFEERRIIFFEEGVCDAQTTLLEHDLLVDEFVGYVFDFFELSCFHKGRVDLLGTVDNILSHQKYNYTKHKLAMEFNFQKMSQKYGKKKPTL
jgi:hypothetical protein